MLWRPINFQGVVAVDKELVEQLQQYLSEREKILAQQIVVAFEPGSDKEYADALSLAEAVSVAREQVEVVKQRVTTGGAPYDLRALCDRLNQALWEYVEVLEGAAGEFLQQLDHVRLDRLTVDTLQAVDGVKFIVIEKVRAVRECLDRLEVLLGEYSDACQPELPWYRRWLLRFPYARRLLDRALQGHLDKTEEALASRDRQLKDGYQEFNRLRLKVRGSLQKLEGYKILKTLDPKAQERFTEVYGLLKMWKANVRSRRLPERDLTRILRMKAPVELVTTTFRDYCSALTAALYEQSRRIKEMGTLSADERRQLHTLLDGYSRELHSLGSSVGRFRDFLLRTDPDPYVRARWGFSERVTGTEPSETRALQRLGFEIEALDDLYGRMLESLQKAPSGHSFRSGALYQSVQSALHELGQPLASRSLMRKRADDLVALLEQIDELGSADPTVVEYVGEVLGKAMRADWKYHVLQEVPGFRQLYNIHMGITDDGEVDEEYQKFLKEWNGLLETIRAWVKKGSVWRFPPSVEEAVEGLKLLLRDRLLGIESVPNEAILRKQARQLLELRYRFARFCLQHIQAHPEGGQLRNHFLFVDQYFEFIENKLNDLEASVLSN